MEHRLCEGLYSLAMPGLAVRPPCWKRANGPTAKDRRGNSGQYLWPAAITFIYLNAWRAASSANSPGWLANCS